MVGIESRVIVAGSSRAKSDHVHRWKHSVENNGDPLPDATPSDHLVQTQNSMDICSNQINEDSKETRSD